MEKSITDTNRGNYVVKANDLIRKGRYDLTTQQQRIVLFAISKIKKADDPHQFYEIPIRELCKACGIQYDHSGYYYEAIKKDMKKLTSPIWMKYPDESEWTLSWFSDVGIVPLSGMVYVRFHERIWRFLFDLKERYTQYRLEEVLAFRGKYAIRFYEILRSYFTREELDNGLEKEIELSVDDMRKKLCLDEVYPTWKEFNRNVIKKAIDEINTYSEQMFVSYEPIKNGRQVVKVRFIVASPETLRERLIRYDNLRKRLPKEKPVK